MTGVSYLASSIQRLASRIPRLWLILGVCVCVLSAGVLHGNEVRVAVLPPQRYARATAGYEPALLHFLEEWAQQQPGVRLLNPERCKVITAWLRSGAFSLSDADFFDAFNAVQPIDVWVDLIPDGGGVLLRVRTADNTEALHLDAKQVTALVPTARLSCAFVAKSLELPIGSAGTQVLDTFVSDAEARAYCSAPWTTARWPGNSGEAQLSLLIPFWSLQRTGPALASRILEATNVQLSSTQRNQDYTPRALTLAKAALPRVLGTPWESSAIALLKAAPDSFTGELVALANKVAENELLRMPDLMTGDTLLKLAAVAAPLGDPLGAVRLLGYLTSKKSLDLLVTLTRAATPAVRVAVAQALLERAEPAAAQALATMRTDADPAVLFLARLSAWRRNPDAGAPVAEARAMLAQGEFLSAVAEVLTAGDGAVDMSALRTLAASADAAARQRALAGLLLASPVFDDPLWASCLTDPDPAVIRQTLRALPLSFSDALQPRLMALCNDPHVTMADAARAALQSSRPADPLAAARFDLATEHPWIRRRIVARLGEDHTPEARAVLIEACTNLNARTRATALVTLMGCDTVAGRIAAVAALADTHRHVRLQAAALVAKHALAADSQILHTVVPDEKDPAIRSYLELALATLNGSESAGAPAARSVAERTALTWMTSMGADAACGYRGTYYDCRFLRSHGGQNRRHISLATLHRCDIIGKYPDDYYDGGVSTSMLFGCLVTRCYQKNNGGVSSSTLYDSAVTGNRGGTTEGGVSGSTLYNCIIASNTTARTGAGLHNSTAVNCRIFANQGVWYGAGAHLSTLYNCLVFSNKVTGASYGGQGSGAYGSSLFNCTVVDNATVVADAGAVYNCKVWNTIIWSNKTSGGIVNYAGDMVLTNCCTTPVPVAGWDAGNTDQAPGFVNAAAGDYRLAAGSPCTDQGLVIAWMRDPADARSRDLDGTPRILPRGGRVDIGAFERNIHQGTILTVR